VAGIVDKKATTGHITALVTIMIWGTTFISTKILLADFTPIEILFFRFLLGLLVLIIIYLKSLKIKDKKQELTFAAAGLCGICLISFNGKELELNPIGDILAVVAALVWAVYSLLTRKISSYGLNTIGTTRKIFTYGILFMLPFLFVFDFNLDVQKAIKPEYAINLIYLGLGASALCFVTWNYAVGVLGTVKTSVYIYIVPVITATSSVIALNEKITWIAAIGIGLTLIGLFLSESKLKFRKRGK
jgi:drug/metabolite transporter (DMT)-like permease